MSCAESCSLLGLRHANRDEQEKFVRSIYAPLYHWLYWLCGDREKSADLTQQTFAAFWQSLANADPSIDAKVWLFAVGRNVWRNTSRSERRDRSVWNDGLQMEHVDHRARPGPQLAMDDERATALRRAVASLTDDIREAVTLRYWANCSYAEIAATLSITAELARQRTFTGRNQLRAMLKSWAPDY